MDQSLLVNVFGSKETDYRPQEMQGEHLKMHRTAGRKSRHAFADTTDLPDSPVQTSTELDPKKTLPYLFQKIGDNWVLEAKRFWFVR